MTLAELLETEGFNEVCDGCRNFRMEFQSHPYGSTTATETLAECDCANDADCPRLKPATP